VSTDSYRYCCQHAWTSQAPLNGKNAAPACTRPAVPHAVLCCVFAADCLTFGFDSFLTGWASNSSRGSTLSQELYAGGKSRL
jgi:hypothetical protein